MVHTVLVTGATGTQGGAVIDALLNHNDGHRDNPITIHAITRDLTSPASIKLAESPNLKLFKGDFDDTAAIKAAAACCTAAFLNVTPVFTDPAGEARHARNLVETCASIPSVKRIIFASSAAMHNKSEDDSVWTQYIPNNPNTWMTTYMTSKKACEEAVMKTSQDQFGEGWTIIRGNTFATNFLPPISKFMYPELETKQTIATALKPERKLSVLDPNDIGVLAARMIICDLNEWNSRWKGRAVPIAKENLTLREVVAIMNETLQANGIGKEIRLIQLEEHEAKQRAAAGDMIVDSQLFQNEYMAAYDLDEVKSFGVDLDSMLTVRAFFEGEVERLVSTVGGA